jgi:hypothetical protein
MFGCLSLSLTARGGLHSLEAEVSQSVFCIVVGTVGAIFQELLYWYNARAKLDTEEYRGILCSRSYWLLVSLMAIGAGIAGYIWFYPDHEAPRTYLLFGAAFPALFKKAVDAFIPKNTRLGVARADGNQAGLGKYFRAS